MSGKTIDPSLLTQVTGKSLTSARKAARSSAGMWGMTARVEHHDVGARRRALDQGWQDVE